MTSLPTTAAHGPSEPPARWKASLKHLLSSLFQYHHTANTANAATPPDNRWHKIYLGRGMINDVKRRAPFFVSDWTDAWDYRVVPATIYMYFANILPALAFSLDM